MKQYTATCRTWNLEQKKVFLRADLNVPLDGARICNDYRLQAILPTIRLLQEKKGHIILATHLGRPHGPNPELSTRLLMPWFEKNGYTLQFAPTLHDASTYSPDSNTITLLENLRFNAEEKKDDPEFAQKLADLADFFVQEAFGALHRNDASIVLLPTLFAPEKRSVGLLVEKETHAITNIVDNAKKPFLAILGGGKVATKLPLIQSLIARTDTICIEPALSFTFLQAANQPVGKSLVDREELATCTTIVGQAQEYGTQLLLPQDYQVAHRNLNGPLSYTQIIPYDSIGVSIGPKTLTQLGNVIKHAKTIFITGMIGIHTREETLEGMKKLLKLTAQSSATTLIGGGNTVDIIAQLNLMGAFNHISTGGGALLAFITGQTMPGLKPFESD